MLDGLEWLWAPALATPPLCRLVELKDGTYDICDVADMNDALAVKAENEYRAMEAARRKG